MTIIVFLALLSLYIAVVAAIVTGRMSRTTPHVTRVCVILAGAVGMWGLAKSFSMTWAGDNLDALHVVAIVLCTAALVSNQRIQV